MLQAGRKVTPGQPRTGLAPSMVCAIHLTIRAALRYGVRQRLIVRNPATEVADLPKPSGEQRACWTTEQTARFLEATQEDRLYALYPAGSHHWHEKGRGRRVAVARRGLEAGTVTVVSSHTLHGKDVDTQPKTPKSRRTIALASVAFEALRGHRSRQKKYKELDGVLYLRPDYVDTGLVFTREDGQPLHPDYALRAFRRAASRAGLPWIAFHAWHGAATAGLQAGVPLLAMSNASGIARSASPATFTAMPSNRWTAKPLT